MAVTDGQVFHSSSATATFTDEVDGSTVSGTCFTAGCKDTVRKGNRSHISALGTDCRLGSISERDIADIYIAYSATIAEKDQPISLVV